MIRVIVLCCLLIGGCASIDVTYNNIPDDGIITSKVFHNTFDDVWTQAVGYFSSTNLTIDKIEKGSGLITAKHTTFRKVVDDDYLYCGEQSIFNPDEGLFGGHNVITRHGKMNIFLSQLNNGVNVRVTIFGDDDIRMWYGMGVPGLSSTAECYTTGKWEKEIFDYMEQRL